MEILELRSFFTVPQVNAGVVRKRNDNTKKDTNHRLAYWPKQIFICKICKAILELIIIVFLQSLVEIMTVCPMKHLVSFVLSKM